jgi:hypothetical protein
LYHNKKPKAMNKIEFKGKEYPTRTFLVTSPEFDGEMEYTIATESLDEALGDAKEEWDTEEHDIDCTIYFYVEDEVIELSAEEICENHLDIEMTLIEEIF